MTYITPLPVSPAAAKAAARQRRPWAGILLSIVFVGCYLLLAGCDQPVKADKPIIRSIKWTKLALPLTEERRLISGAVKPMQFSRLSFETGGRIRKIRVKVGDTVKAGDVLAELDVRPLNLARQQAESQLSAARARLVEHRGELQRHRKLFRDGWVAKAKLDRVKAGYDSAASTVVAAQAEVDLRTRDVRLAVMRAPFSGVIAKKFVQSFQEVAAGDPVVQLDGSDGFKVAIQVPATLIATIKRSQAVAVRFPTIPDLELKGVVLEIGSQADAGNTFPVTVALVDTDPALRAGMAAEAALLYRPKSVGRDFVVPPAAILAGATDEYFLFRFDVDTSTLQKVAVRLETLRENEFGVDGDIKEGDIIATAGVEFLSDGLEVRLMKRP